jgi:drug/metabolite transporter (DMT)-like permease
MLYFSRVYFMTEAERQHRWRVILAFGLVYFFWGSTYLGIRIGVETIPPALMCGIRFSIAGVIMLLWCALSGRRVVYNATALCHMAVVGLLLLMGGNLTLAYSEQIVPSGLAALLIAIVPLWFLVLDHLLLGHHKITRRGLAGLGLGIIGMIVLLWPDLRATGALGHAQLYAALTLPVASFSWALGSVLSKKWDAGEDRLSATAWQMTFAGAGNFAFAAMKHDFTHVAWSAHSVGAVIYLVVCGSWIGYTAYIYLLGHVPTAKVSTYAYVNPVVAVFLGWLIEHERVDHFILAGTAVIVTSVVLVTSAKVEKKETVLEMPAVESVGD